MAGRYALSTNAVAPTDQIKHAGLLRGIERPSRYIGGEYGLQSPPQGSAPKLKIALGFPDVYEVGMSHLGFRLLHSELVERQADAQVERFFLPWPDLQRRLQDQGLELFTLEHQTPLSEVHMIGMSVQFELAYPAVIRILDLAGIPRTSEQRAGADRPWPLFIVGGGAALNPEPLAPFVDAFFLGEADHAIHELVDLLQATMDAPRSQRMAQLAQVPGVYVPELVEVTHDPAGLGVTARALPPAMLPIERRWIEDLDALAVPASHLVPSCKVVHDRVTVELQRGCCHGCRFCQAGYVTRPTRQRGTEAVLQTARQLLASTGYQDLALLSLSAGDHPCLQEILAALIEEHGPRQVALSLPSMRTESLDPRVAAHISKIRKTTVTLAPEAATDRLRRVINKQNTEQDLLRSVAAVMSCGYSRIKLYFMIGLPTETDHDVVSIASLADRVLAKARSIRRSTSLTVSISTFVPKPHTALQWEAAPQPAEVQRKVALLRDATPRGIRLRWHDAGQSLVESYLARGDRRLAAVLDRLVTADHSGMDAWTDHFRLEPWQGALEAAAAAGQIPAPALYLQARDPATPLPWDHLDVGLERGYLEQERLAALAGRQRPDCTDGTCDSCGVCPSEPLHRLAQPAAPAAPAEAPAVDQAEHQPCQVRIWFHKVQRASLMSHLEMVGVFEHAARRAELPLDFSRGFHPKPRMRFTPALPLGAHSQCEFLELGLRQPMDPDELHRRLGGQLPPGLPIQRCELVQDKLMGRIRGVRWLLQPGLPLDADALEQARARLAAGPLLLQRAKGKQVDLSAVVQGLRQVDDGWIEVECSFGARGTVKPDEILRGLLGHDAVAAQQAEVVRLSWQLEAVPEAPADPPEAKDL